MGLLESLINAVGTKTRQCAAGIPIEFGLKSDLYAIEIQSRYYAVRMMQSDHYAIASTYYAVGTKTRHCTAGIPIELELKSDLRALKFKRPPTTTHLKF
jgi:hypothetical protein